MEITGNIQYKELKCLMHEKSLRYYLYRFYDQNISGLDIDRWNQQLVKFSY